MNLIKNKDIINGIIAGCGWEGRDTIASRPPRRRPLFVTTYISYLIKHIYIR